MAAFGKVVTSSMASLLGTGTLSNAWALSVGLGLRVVHVFDIGQDVVGTVQGEPRRQVEDGD